MSLNPNPHFPVSSNVEAVVFVLCACTHLHHTLYGSTPMSACQVQGPTTISKPTTFVNACPCKTIGKMVHRIETHYNKDAIKIQHMASSISCWLHNYPPSRWYQAPFLEIAMPQSCSRGGKPTTTAFIH